MIAFLFAIQTILKDTESELILWNQSGERNIDESIIVKLMILAENIITNN